jgi:anaerobic selenocysteine-containing dehydrogenase
MGIDTSYPFINTETWLNFMLNPAKITLKNFKERQVIYVTPTAEYRKYLKEGFATPSKKVELSSKGFHHFLPIYTEPANIGLKGSLRHLQSYPLLATSKRPSLFVHTKLHNIKVLAAQYPEPCLYIHPEDAAERNIGDGEMVEVSSARGGICVKTQVTEDSPKGIVRIDFGWGNPTDGKANINILTSDEYWCPVCGATPNRFFIVEVSKLHVFAHGCPERNLS